MTAALGAADLANVAGQALVLEDVQALVAAGAGVAAMTMLRRRSEVTVLSYGPLAQAIALAGMGFVALDLGPAVGDSGAIVIANLLFASGAVRVVATIVPAMYRRLDRRSMASAGLDGAIVLVAGITLMLTLWLASSSGPGDISGRVVPILAVGLLTSAGVAVISALALRSAPGLNGIWCSIAGVAVLGLSGVVWLDLSFHGPGRNVPASLLFSSGLLLVAYGWMTWNEEVGGGSRYDGRGTDDVRAGSRAADPRRR